MRPALEPERRVGADVDLLDVRTAIDELVDEARVRLARELGDEDAHAGVRRAGHVLAGLVDERQAAPVDLPRDEGRGRGAERGRDERGRRRHDRAALLDRHCAAQVEDLRARLRDGGEAVDALHGGAAQAEELEDGGAGLRHRHGGAERDDQRRGGEDERAPVQPAARRVAGGEAAEHGVGDVGRVREGELVAEGEQGALELGHGPTPRRSRSRSRAREVRDLTVPRRQPSTSAVSSSERPRK